MYNKIVNKVIKVWTKYGSRKLEKKYAPALDNNEQSCFVRSDF